MLGASFYVYSSQFNNIIASKQSGEGKSEKNIESEIF